MLTQGHRPRELRWYHAGPMLFGDWGTSRLYVLGLCFLYNAFASIWFMLAMSMLLVAVGWAYHVISRIYTEGGGVYTAARQRSPLLGMIGGLLLCADYVVTASISALDAMHYLNLPAAHWWAAGGILLIGIINYFGPRKSGTLAMVVAILTVTLTLVIAFAALPYLGKAQVAPAQGGPTRWWTGFTMIILAISGVEAISNMTGIMVQPVRKTAKWSILPVVIEIVVLNLVMTLAMQAVPLEVLGDGNPANAYTAHRDDMMKLLASYYVGPIFAMVAAVVFAMLLLSAVNTAVTDLVSIQYMMSKDKELPRIFGGLNRWGMPVLGLVIATLVPLVLLLIVPDVEALADLYAIGIIGAVSVNLASTSTNYQLEIKPWERYCMMALAAVMIAIWISIAIAKPHALMFAAGMLVVGLGARWFARNRQHLGGWLLKPIPTFTRTDSPSQPEGQVVPVAAVTPPVVGTRSRILVATRGNKNLIQFAMEEAKHRNADLYILYVHEVAVVPMGPPQTDYTQNANSNAFFAELIKQSTEKGVMMEPLYLESSDVADAILHAVVSNNIQYLILGTSTRGMLWKTMKGDVIQMVAQKLPQQTTLLIHA